MHDFQKIDELFGTEKIKSFSILRLDLPDPLSGGNKKFKLKYNLEEMEGSGFKTMLTFGGAFSNHIAAVATAGKKNNFRTIGIIRGDELTEMSNPVLQYASDCGMQLIFISRDDYRKRNDLSFCEFLLAKYGPAYLLPEGGSNALAVQGCAEILSDKTGSYDVIICPVGTGATLAGIISSAQPNQEIIGVAVLEGRNYLENEVEKFLDKRTLLSEWKIEHDFTLGAYGKSSVELKKFVAEAKNKFGLPLDEVYSGKALFAVSELIKRNDFSEKKVLFIHTGGYAFVP